MNAVFCCIFSAQRYIYIYITMTNQNVWLLEPPPPPRPPVALSDNSRIIIQNLTRTYYKPNFKNLHQWFFQKSISKQFEISNINIFECSFLLHLFCSKIYIYIYYNDQSKCLTSRTPPPPRPPVALSDNSRIIIQYTSCITLVWHFKNLNSSLLSHIYVIY